MANKRVVEHRFHHCGVDRMTDGALKRMVRPDDERLSPSSFEFSDVSNGPVLLSCGLPLATLDCFGGYLRIRGRWLSRFIFPPVGMKDLEDMVRIETCVNGGDFPDVGIEEFDRSSEVSDSARDGKGSLLMAEVYLEIDQEKGVSGAKGSCNSILGGFLPNNSATWVEECPDTTGTIEFR